MAVLTWPRTGDLVRDLESYMAREREIGVWGFPHYVRYLRAITLKLSPQPHRCTEAVLDAAAQVLATGKPALLQRLMTTLPERRGPSRVAREAANAICEVIGAWAGWDAHAVAKLRAGDVSPRAYDAVKRIEQAAMTEGRLTPDDLYVCACDAFSDEDVDDDRRDAAVAAMSAGHFNLGREIIVGE